ncbi:MAG: Response regulator receiver domain protein [Candidatus Methanoperedenaceae archaeon GB50]|nr:MAG: Response regulator receiver domain protein [Candidatus Methanoperedenaceae archaeon GB50]
MSKLLLVEDNREVAKIISDFLCISGYSVDTAFNINMALELFNKNSYDFIITDENLPDRKGSYLVNQIKEMSQFTRLGYQWKLQPASSGLILCGCRWIFDKTFHSKAVKRKDTCFIKEK